MDHHKNETFYIGLVGKVSQEVKNSLNWVCEYMSALNPNKRGKIVLVFDGDDKFEESVYYIKEKSGTVYLGFLLYDNNQIKWSSISKNCDVRDVLYGVCSSWFLATFVSTDPVDFYSALKRAETIQTHVIEYETIPEFHQECDKLDFTRSGSIAYCFEESRGEFSGVERIDALATVLNNFQGTSLDDGGRVIVGFAMESHSYNLIKSRAYITIFEP
ncbi:MAG: hypothetical protein HWE10_05920 [Gammaproteobacteria bacterium]|nr:hypothetical protein [Gammaproteobacteria bacterium]